MKFHQDHFCLANKGASITKFDDGFVVFHIKRDTPNHSDHTIYPKGDLILRYDNYMIEFLVKLVMNLNKRTEHDFVKVHGQNMDSLNNGTKLAYDENE